MNPSNLTTFYDILFFIKDDDELIHPYVKFEIVWEIENYYNQIVFFTYEVRNKYGETKISSISYTETTKTIYLTLEKEVYKLTTPSYPGLFLMEKIS